MGKAVGEKYHQATGQRRNVELRAIVEMHAQGTTITFLPVRVEVGHRGDATAVVVAETIQVRLVERSGRVQGKVALELFQAQEQGLVEAKAQFVHQRKIAVADRRLSLFQPMNVIAANALANRHGLTSTDACRRQCALGLASAALRRQFMSQIRRKE